jgi:purine-binding chemotaxis protein CheW
MHCGGGDTGDAASVMMGIVVDSVSEVLNIKSSDVEDTPTFGVKLNTQYILGMAKINNAIKILLDIDLVLSKEELESLAA